MATPKKKHLIELMIEADVEWPVGAEYAAQDKRGLYVWFYSIKPKRTNYDSWSGVVSGSIIGNYQLDLLCRNWHQTIVTREQYEKALYDSGRGQAGEMPSDEPVASATPSIEQLAADYHAKAEEAQRMQLVADNALKLVDDALAALEGAGEAIGLVISIDAKPSKLGVTDWRDLQVGDIVECVTLGGDEIESLKWCIGKQCTVVKTEEPGRHRQPVKACFSDGQEWWIGEFKFIRRP